MLKVLLYFIILGAVGESSLSFLLVTGSFRIPRAASALLFGAPGARIAPASLPARSRGDATTAPVASAVISGLIIILPAAIAS